MLQTVLNTHESTFMLFMLHFMYCYNDMRWLFWVCGCAYSIECLFGSVEVFI